MPSNITVKVTADTAELTARLAVAKAESAQFTKELNSLAREAVASGSALDGELKSNLITAGEAAAAAKLKVQGLGSEMRSTGLEARALAGAASFAEQALAPLLALMSAAVIEQFLVNIIRTAAEVKHEAEVLGLSTTAYQTYSKSAEFAGVATDTVTMALSRFNVAQGNAQNGAKDQVEAFRELGVNAFAPMEIALHDAAGALLQVQDHATKARLEVALFGRSGQEMNPVLEQWARNQATLTEELQRTGHVLSPEVSEAANEARTEWNRLIDAMEVRGIQGMLGAVHGIEAVVEKLKELASWAYRAENAVTFGHLAEVFGKPSDPNALPFNTKDLLAQQHALSANQAQTAPLPQMAGIEVPKAGSSSGGGSGRDLAEEARRLADQITQIWKQAALAHVQSEEETNSHLLQIGQETVQQFITQAEALENKRYGIELEGIRKREVADKGNSGAIERDKAQEATLLQAHEDRITHIHEQGTEKRIASDKKETDEFIKDRQEALQYDTKNIEDLYEEHFLSDQQRHDLERQLTVAIQQEVLRRKDAEIAGLKEQTDAWKQAIREKTELERKFSADIRAIDTTLTKYQESQFEQGFHIMSSGFNTAITSMMFHSQTFEQAMLQLALSIGEGFVNMGLEIAEKWAMSQLETLLFEKTADLGKITDASAVAGANAYAAWAAYPPVAAAMAAAAVAETMSFAGLLSAEGGLERVAYDGQLIRAHEGEAVLPRRIAEPLMSVVQNLGSSGSSAGGGFGGNVQMTNNWNIKAQDSHDVSSFLKKNSTRRAWEKTLVSLARKHKIKFAA